LCEERRFMGFLCGGWLLECDGGSSWVEKGALTVACRLSPDQRSGAGVPKSPASGLKSVATPASAPGAKGAADKEKSVAAASALVKVDKENADGNNPDPNASLGASQPANSRRGLFNTPTPGNCLDEEAAGGEEGAAHGACSPAPSQQKGESEREGESAGAKGPGPHTDEAQAAEKSEAVQYLEKRLALARKQITPIKCGGGGGKVAWGDGEGNIEAAPASNVTQSAEGEEEDADGTAGRWHAGEEAVTCGEGCGKAAEEVEVGKEVARADAVPFARWIASGCPIGTKSRVSGVCVETHISTPLAAVREGSAEGASSSVSGNSVSGNSVKFHVGS
jgi:hypothetical protein